MYEVLLQKSGFKPLLFLSHNLVSFWNLPSLKHSSTLENLFLTAAMDFQDLLYEVNARTSAPVPEFIKRYFDKPVIASNTTASDGAISDEVPTIPPTSAASNSFPEWFTSFATTNRDGARGIWSISAKDENHSVRGLLNECT